MKLRCYDETDDSFANYGGRGIVVCDRWLKDFATFYEDMGDRPAGMTLGRIDNEGNYDVGNCRWETSWDQSTNKRTTVWVTIGGERRKLVEVCRERGVGLGVVYGRLRNGWDIEDALIRAVRVKRGQKAQREEPCGHLYNHATSRRMARGYEVLNIWIPVELKERLRRAAAREKRSLTKTVEVALEKYLVERGSDNSGD